MSTDLAKNPALVRSHRANSEIGMLVTLSSFGMLFGTLILSFFLAKARSPVWPPLGVEPIRPLIPTTSSLVIIFSSVFAEFSIRAWRQENLSYFLKYWKQALACTLLFLGSQVALWAQLYSVGQKLNSNLFSAIFFTITAFHALHVLAVLLLMLFVWKKAPSLDFSSQKPKMVSWALHFLGIVWIIVYFSLVIF